MTEAGHSGDISALKQRLLERVRREKAGRSPQEAAQPVSGIPRRDSDVPAQLSFAQRRLWLLDQLTSDNAAYTFTNIVRLNGRLNEAALRRAIVGIVERHEILRTVYRTVDGVPVQIIQPHLELDIPLLDLSTLAESKREATLQSRAGEEARKVFCLAEEPLLRACLVRFSAENHALVLTMHHIVYDGWSLAVLFSELKQLYESYDRKEPTSLTDLPIQYADFAEWERQQLETSGRQQQRQYWLNQLAGDLPILQLPFDRPRPAEPTHQGAMQWFRLSKELTEELEDLARREDCTLFMVLMAAFNVLMGRYAGQEEIIVGTPIANRNRRETEGLIGFFINGLVFRTSLQGNPEFCDLLSRVKEVALGAYANQGYPFEEIVQELQPDREINQNPLFQVMFALQNTPPPPDNIGDLAVSIEEVDSGTSVFDITVSLYQTEGGINGYFEYSTALFDQATIERMIGHYQTLLKHIVEDPEARLSELSLLSDAEYRQITEKWNATDRELEFKRCIHGLIEDQVDSGPDRLALVHQNTQLTYRQLDERANQLARELQRLGVESESVVGVCMERSTDMFVAILAILKAGGGYLPLDPDYPPQRISYMLEDSQASIVVTHSALSDVLPEEVGRVIELDREWPKIESFPPTRPPRRSTDESLAYVIYTSGSTGQPKGVMVTHGNVVHSTLARLAYYERPVERFLLLSSFSFDSSVAGIFWTLCSGGELHLPNAGVEGDLNQVCTLIREVRVSHFLCLPSVYSFLLNLAQEGQLDSVHCVIVAGEACPPTLPARHFQAGLKADLFNEYGPTEGSVWSTVHRFIPEEMGETMTIGRPIPNVQIYILDMQLNPVPVGVSGEIYVGGAQLARGYLNRPELTARAFVENPFQKAGSPYDRLYRTGDVARFLPDGKIEFIGREDSQVKLRGYRVELGEIEARLMTFPDVGQVVVVVREDQPGDQRLVAYYVPEQGKVVKATPSEFRAHLRKDLPRFMIPQYIVPLEVFPLTPNGKLDKSALPVPYKTGGKPKGRKKQLSTEGERQIAAIWEDLLGVENVRPDDNFFELGGHSLLSLQFLKRVKDETGVDISLRDVPLNSLAQFGAMLNRATKASQAAEDVGETRPLELAPEPQKAIGRGSRLKSLFRR